MSICTVKRRGSVIGLIVCAALVAMSAPAQIITLDRPAEGQFIVDKAGLITQDDAEHIRTVCSRLLAENGIPVIIVTINAMRDHGAPDIQIETFGTLLFDQWGIGNKDKNLGILFLVSSQDRASRIALGADWDREADRTSERIMNETIIPYFKQGQFSQGIRAGVDALDILVQPRESEAPAAPAVVSHEPAVANVESARRVAPPSIPARQILSQHARPVHTKFIRPGRTSFGGSGLTSGGGLAGLLCMGAPLAIFGFIAISIVSAFLRLVTGHQGGFASDASDDWIGPSRRRRRGLHFGDSSVNHHRTHTFGGGSIFHGGSFGGGSTHHGSSFGGGSSHHGSSFGGGSTHGGGATGRW